MPFTMIDGTGPVISAKISGELGKSEVSQMQAAALQAIRRCGKISALFILERFEGWKSGDEWGDVTFMSQHDQEIMKIAVVGEEGWRDMIYAFLAKGFRQAEIEYFLLGEISRARSWLAENQRS
jgi:hypothetical protein